MTTDRLANRWGIAVAAVIMQLCLGAVYGWSVFVKPLINSAHWTLTQVSLTFTLAIVFLGVGTVIGGLWQDRVGPRRVATVAGILYGIGYMVAALAAAHHSLAGMYVGYGVLSGLGMGMGYICPVATLVKWFPDRRGLMTGVAVCGYGAGALVMSPLAAREILAVGVPATFLTLGIVYLILVVMTAQFYQNPPQGWHPEGWEPRSAVSKAASTYDFTVKEAMSTPQFWLLWVMLFLNVSAGIMIISQASPMAQQLVGLTPVAAAGIVGVISIFNGLDASSGQRFPTISGAPAFISCCFSFRSAFSSPCRSCTRRRCSPRRSRSLDSVMAAASAPCRRSPRTSSAPSTWEESMAGSCLLGVPAAIPSPILIARVRQTTGTYQPAILVIAIVMVCSLILPLIARRPKNTLGKIITLPKERAAA